MPQTLRRQPNSSGPRQETEWAQGRPRTRRRHGDGRCFAGARRRGLPSICDRRPRGLCLRQVRRPAQRERGRPLPELSAQAPFPISPVETNNHEAFADTPENPWDPRIPRECTPSGGRARTVGPSLGR
jgi:hypothetical protein